MYFSHYKDFRRRDLEGFHNKVLEDGVRHFKAEEEGKTIMCEAVEKYAKEYAKEYAQGQYDKGQSDMILKMLRNGMTAEAIAQCAEVDLKLVRKIEKTALQHT